MTSTIALVTKNDTLRMTGYLGAKPPLVSYAALKGCKRVWRTGVGWEALSPASTPVALALVYMDVPLVDGIARAQSRLCMREAVPWPCSWRAISELHCDGDHVTTDCHYACESCSNRRMEILGWTLGNLVRYGYPGSTESLQPRGFLTSPPTLSGRLLDFWALAVCCEFRELGSVRVYDHAQEG